jgi:hypothetical protein
MGAHGDASLTKVGAGSAGRRTEGDDEEDDDGNLTDTCSDEDFDEPSGLEKLENNADSLKR